MSRLCIFRNTSASKSKMLTLLIVRATGERNLPCDKMLVAHISLRILYLYPVFSACYWEALQKVGIFRCIWIYGNKYMEAKSVRVWNQIKWKYWVMVWQWWMLCSEQHYLNSVGGRQAGRPCRRGFGFTVKNLEFYLWQRCSILVSSHLCIRFWNLCTAKTFRFTGTV